MNISMKKISTRSIVLFAIFALCTVLGVVLGVKVEHFSNFYKSTRSECPTRNMSYDLRGDVPIPRRQMSMLNSELGPIQPDMCGSSLKAVRAVKA